MASTKKSAAKPRKKVSRQAMKGARRTTKTPKGKAAKPKVAKAKTAKPGKKKKVIRYKSPLAKKIPLPKAARFKWVRHPLDGRGIKFRVPTSWKYTWGSEDNSLYYPVMPGMTGPSPVGGRLFVRFRLEPVNQAYDGAAYGLLMSHRTDPGQKVTQLESGAFLLHFKTTHNSEGYHAVDYFWFLAKPMPPRRIALASFLFA